MMEAYEWLGALLLVHHLIITGQESSNESSNEYKSGSSSQDKRSKLGNGGKNVWPLCRVNLDVAAI